MNSQRGPDSSLKRSPRLEFQTPGPAGPSGSNGETTLHSRTDGAVGSLPSSQPAAGGQGRFRSLFWRLLHWLAWSSMVPLSPGVLRRPTLTSCRCRNAEGHLHYRAPPHSPAPRCPFLSQTCNLYWVGSFPFVTEGKRGWGWGGGQARAWHCCLQRTVPRRAVAREAHRHLTLTPEPC